MAKKNKNNDDYSLSKAFSKLAKVAEDSKTSITIGSTETGVTSGKKPQNYSSQDTPDLSSTQTHLLVSMHSSIDGIRTDLSDTQNTMYGNVEKLRTDLETKINGKVDSLYFGGAIAILIGFVLLVYNLSYDPLLKRVDEFDKKFINKTLFDSLNKKVDSNSDFVKNKDNFVSTSEFNSLETIVDANQKRIDEIDTDSNGS